MNQLERLRDNAVTATMSSTFKLSIPRRSERVNEDDEWTKASDGLHPTPKPAVALHAFVFNDQRVAIRDTTASNDASHLTLFFSSTIPLKALLVPPPSCLSHSNAHDVPLHHTHRASTRNSSVLGADTVTVSACPFLLEANLRDHRGGNSCPVVAPTR